MKKMMLPAALTAPRSAMTCTANCSAASRPAAISDPGRPPHNAPMKTYDRGRPPWNSSLAPEATEAAPIASIATESKRNHKPPEMTSGWRRDMYQVRNVQRVAKPTAAYTIQSRSGRSSCRRVTITRRSIQIHPRNRKTTAIRRSVPSNSGLPRWLNLPLSMAGKLAIPRLRCRLRNDQRRAFGATLL